MGRTMSCCDCRPRARGACWAATLLLLGLAVPAASQDARTAAHRPNVSLEVHQRSFAPNQNPYVRVCLYNLSRVQLSAYSVDIEQLVPKAYSATDRTLARPGSLPYQLAHLDLSRLRPAKTWTHALKKIYPDNWADSDVRVPLTAPGVYVILASGGGVQARTWLALTTRAMVTKRSPDKLLAWVVDAKTGQPVPGVPVALYGMSGRLAVAATGKDGLARFQSPPQGNPCFLATRGGPPAFVLSGAPAQEKPFRIYVYTDRPVYRPGHVVRFRGTVRRVARGRYSLPAGLQSVTAKIRTRGATVYEKQHDVTEWGTFDGEFALAPEPPLGEYDLVTEAGQGSDRTVAYSSFSVLAYRKPEFEVKVSIPQAHYLGGATVPVTISADYYFGSPVSGGKVAYEVSFSQAGEPVPARVLSAAGLGTAGIAEVEEGLSGEATLDEQGKFVLEVPTRHLPVTRSMSVRAEVSELALRPREASAWTLITAAKFNLTVVPDDGSVVVGDPVVLRVTTRDHDDKPVSERVEVTVIEWKYDRQGRAYEERTKSEVETDAEGQATVTFKPQRPGGYQVEAWAMDDVRNPVFAHSDFHVRDKEPERPLPSLSMEADRETYRPGDVAVVHVRTNLLGAWALMTVEGEFLYDAIVHRILASEFDLRVPVTDAYVPGLRVRLVMVRDGDERSGSARLDLPPEDRRLDLLIAPDRQTYEPGQKATYSLTVRDHQGRGVTSDLGLGVVDAGVYAIREDQTPDPFQVFWGRVASRVSTDFSLAKLYPGGAYQAAGSAPSEAKAEEEAPETEEGIRLRRRFLDTAYWAPSIVTGPDGRAEVSFDLPDNLTTWRATARALTDDAKAGEARNNVTVTMPLLVRLALPRFYVAGDEGTAAAIVHNYTGQTRSAKVALSATGARVLGEPEQTISLAPEGIQRLTWPIEALGPDQARFLVSADGGPDARDAMESTLPVLANGVKNVDAFAGVIEETAQASIPLPADALPTSTSLEVSLSPSLAGPLFDALDYLASYPYGCAEQTMDSFLPDVIVARTLAALGVQRPKPPQLERYVSFGLQKLIRYQHEDGGWHWWEFDDSDPYISAYIVYGLKMAAEAGYVAAEAPLRRGVPYLLGALAEEKYHRAQAYLLWALAFADIWNAESLQQAVQVAAALYDDRDRLDLFSRASLTRALARLAEQEDLKPEARALLAGAATTLAGELEASAQRTGVGAYWPSGTRESWSWMDNDVEVTAQVLSALLEAKPASDTLVPTVRWLMAARRGKSWFSTKDTAAAVLALAAYLEIRPRELSPDCTVRVSLGGKELTALALSAADTFAAPREITVQATDLRPGDNVLRFDLSGHGTVYWAARLHYLLPADKALPAAEGLTVTRTYRLAAESPVEAADQPSGNVVQVELTLRADRNLRYAILEEPIPAGCEVIAGDDEPWRSPWDRREVWDNRIVFFFDYLRRGDHTLSYVLRTETPGKYRILPTQAALMYFPEVRGRNASALLRVVEEE